MPVHNHHLYPSFLTYQMWTGPPFLKIRIIMITIMSEIIYMVLILPLKIMWKIGKIIVFFVLLILAAL